MGRAQPRGSGRRALAAACLLQCACVEPDVDALAVWLEGTATRFELYDGGERRSMPFETVVADSDPSFLQIDVLPGGHGFLVVPRNDTMVWIDARDGGYAAVGYDAQWGKLAPDADILDSGTVVTRWNMAGTGMVILPTVRGSEGPIWFEKPEVYALAGVPFSLRAPADGSVLYAIPPPGNGPGTIIVYQLRSSGMLELDRTELTWRLSETSGTLIEARCEWGACLAPEGDALLAMEGIRPCQPHSTCPQLPPYRCRVMRYRWAARPDLGEPRIEALLLPDECHPYQPDDGNPDTPLAPSTEGPELLAALSQSVVILEDDFRIYRADLDRRSWQSIPKLGVGPLRLFPVEQGHAALLLADNLQVIRADEHGLRIHSAEQMTCDDLDSTVVSPDGQWLLTVCVRASAIIDFPQPEDATRTIVRISSLGLEHFDGIAMRGLAIDDGGNALLYSFAAKDNDQAPRGLFVLDAAGHLARVDTLEPAPLELMPCAADENCYFSAQAHEE